MVIKKNTAAPATSHGAKKARRNKAAQDETVPVETPFPTEPVVAEATASTIPPTREPLPTSTPMPVPYETAAQAQTEEPPQGEAASLPITTTTKLSALEAALRVLGESGQVMNCRELIAAMATQGYWSSTKGRAPASTLCASLLRELQSKGEKARVVKTGRGKFMLKSVP
jgi:hypothetical protein